MRTQRCPCETRLGEERGERRAGLVLRHAVQIDLVADRELAATKPAQHGIGSSVATESELVTRLDVEVVRVESEQVGDDRLPRPRGAKRRAGGGARVRAAAAAA